MLFISERFLTDVAPKGPKPRRSQIIIQKFPTLLEATSISCNSISQADVIDRTANSNVVPLWKSGQIVYQRNVHERISKRQHQSVEDSSKRKK